MKTIMKNLSKSEAQKIIIHLKNKTYLNKKDREKFILVNKLIINGTLN